MYVKWLEVFDIIAVKSEIEILEGFIVYVPGEFA